jgi:hypothetical protein
MAATRPAIFGAIVSGRMRLKYYDCAQYHDVIAIFGTKEGCIRDRSDGAYLNV